MAEITKTVIYPIPTEWYGDTQDTNMSGICTYTGPDRITIWYRNIGTDENPKWVQEHSFPSDEPEDRNPPVECRVVELNARTHTLNAIALWGGIEGPRLIETPAGPDSEPNPVIPDDAILFPNAPMIMSPSVNSVILPDTSSNLL